MRTDELVSNILVEEEIGSLITKAVLLDETLPDTASKFAVGCLLTSKANGKVYRNVGTELIPSWNDVDQTDTAEIPAGAVTLAKLATGITPSHVIKFARVGLGITTTALTGLVVGDLVIRFVADGTVTCKPVATINTLPDDPADTDYLVVLRAAA